MISKLYIYPMIILMTLIVHFSHSQIPLDGLIGYYKLDKNAADSSGMGHNGFIIDKLTSTKNRFGESNKAYYFDNGYIHIGNPVAYRITGAISICGWINPNQNTNWAAIVSKWASFGDGGYYLGVNPSTQSVRWNLGMPIPIEGSKLVIGKWIHIVATYDRDSVKIYENGKIVNSLAYRNSIINTQADLLIGNQFNQPKLARFNGTIDDVLIYNRALTFDEVYGIYGAQLTQTENILLDPSIDVFPNPANNVLTILNKSKYSILSYSLFDSSGVEIRKGIFMGDLDISDLLPGIYYLLLNTEKVKFTKKIIKL